MNLGTRIISRTLVYMYTIYDAPLDFPDHFVMRRHRIVPGDVIPEFTAGLYTSLEQARADIPSGCVNLGREPHDESQIVETWV